MKKVGIFGRPNVGKSTLFNRLLGEEKSLVSEFAGTTRDFLDGIMKINNMAFQLIDFGGVEDAINGSIESYVQKTIEENISKVDLIYFVVDGSEGITEQDKKNAEMLRQNRKEVVLVVNKVDSQKRLESAYEYYSLGFENTIFLSAIHNKNIDALKAITFEKLKGDSYLIDENDIAPKIAIVGRPNVGKSSIFNAICKAPRSIVSDIAGTTRDAIDVTIQINSNKYVFIDTAGLRRKSKISKDLDIFSSKRAIQTINKADLIIYIIDAATRPASYDTNLLNYIFEKGKSVLVVFNKWDLVAGEMGQINYSRRVITDNSIFKKMPLLFSSAKEENGIGEILESVEKLNEISRVKITTAVLNKKIKILAEKIKLGRTKIMYATQIGNFPFEIAIFSKRKEKLKKQQIIALEEKIREQWKLYGVSIKASFRDS